MFEHAQLRADFEAKTQGNITTGRGTFYRGDYKPFRGYQRTVSSGIFDTTLEFTAETLETINDRVIAPLDRLNREILAHSNRPPLILAGKGDIPFHSQIQPGFPKNLSQEQIQSIHEWLKSPNSGISQVLDGLVGLTFQYDTLVLAPNIYICAEKFGDDLIPFYLAKQAVLEAQKFALKQIPEDQLSTEAFFGSPFRYDDIQYSSIGRFIAQAQPSDLVYFAHQAETQIGTKIKRWPINVTVANVYLGSALNFQERAPHLLS